jgi:hypothetical protein
MNRYFVTDDGSKIVGDPHLGKVFLNGVPLARRGERERLQRQAFLQALNPQGARLHIILGDLFDRPKVSFETISTSISPAASKARGSRSSMSAHSRPMAMARAKSCT